MKKLIPFAQRFVAGVSTRTVSARELHQFLNVRRDFSNWIKSRIEQYGFVENQDYLEVYAKIGENSSGGRPRAEYYLTLDMAKELSMVERTEQGKKARRYFIECEKALRIKNEESDAVNDAEKIRLANDLIASLNISDDIVLIPRVRLMKLVSGVRYFQHTLTIVEQALPPIDGPDWLKHTITDIESLTGRPIQSDESRAHGDIFEQRAKEKQEKKHGK